MKEIDFVAIDFEYAVPFKGSVCSVGIVSFMNGNIVDEYTTLIQPPNNEYSPYTIRVHGITPEQTKKAPTFKEVYPEIQRRIKNHTVVAHNAYSTDKACLEQAMEINGITEDLNINWQCTYAITHVRLDIASKVCNISLNHHEAISDAIACGRIYDLYKNNILPIDAISKANIVTKKKSNRKTLYEKRLKGDVFKPDFDHATNKTTPFFMKKVVVTGFLYEQKKEIVNELNSFGADVDTSVTKKTNFLIIGENAGPSKLAKMRKNIDDGREAIILDLECYLKLIK